MVLKNRNWKINIENGSFHSIKCFNNNYLLSKVSEDVCNHCLQLEYNTDIAEILKRSYFKLNNILSINHHFLSYQQLKLSLDHKSQKINELKLNTLNLRRSNISLMNKTSDLKRLMNLISQNDIPRIKQLISACLKSKVSTIAMIEKMQSAINGK